MQPLWCSPLLLSHSCTTANGNEPGAKNCQSGAPSERAFFAPQWVRVAQTRLAFLWDFGRKWAEQWSSTQIQLSPSLTAFSFWFCFQGVPTCGFQHIQDGLPATEGGLHPQVGLAMPRQWPPDPQGVSPAWTGWLRPPRPSWGCCDGNSPLWEHKEGHQGGMAPIPGIASASFQKDSGNVTTLPHRTFISWQNWGGFGTPGKPKILCLPRKIQAWAWVEHWVYDPICQDSVMGYKVKGSSWKFSAQQRSRFFPVLQVSLGNKGSIKVFQLLIQRSGILQNKRAGSVLEGSKHKSSFCTNSVLFTAQS